MSIARWGSEGSDVYVYDGSNGIVCESCPVQRAATGKDTHIADSERDMISHLHDHLLRGDCVPASAFHALQARMRDESGMHRLPRQNDG